MRKLLRQNPVKGQSGLIFVNCLNVPQFEITPLFVKINNWQFLRHNTWVGGFKRPRPGLTSNHWFHGSGFISATTYATFRTTNHGLKYKHLNFGLWDAVKFELRPIGIVRKLGGGSAKTMDEVVVTIQSHTLLLDQQKSLRHNPLWYSQVTDTPFGHSDVNNANI
jgi:hypothetical protein